MIRSTDLRGHAVVDIDSASKIGQIDEVILDPGTQRVAGLVVSQGQSLLGDKRHVLVPVSAVQSVGPDAVTVHGSQTSSGDSAYLAALPRAGMFIGRKVVTQGGKLLGAIGDVLISREDGRILGYALEQSAASGGLSAMFGGSPKERRTAYVRADADLRLGNDLIVVPDDAIVQGEPVGTMQSDAGMPSTTASSPVEWSEPAAAPPTDGRVARTVIERRPVEPRRVQGAIHPEAEVPFRRDANDVQAQYLPDERDRERP